MNLTYIVSKRTPGANPFLIFNSLQELDSEELATQLKLLTYPKFLQTAYWFAVSSKAKATAGMRCQVCNSPERIQPHHRTYKTHGYEHLNMIDLVVLCHSCHGLFHGHQTPDYVPALLYKPRERRERRVKASARLIPHTEADIALPSGDLFALTEELIARCRTARGAFTNATLKAFGLHKPLITGWPERLIGKVLTREQYADALRGRFIYRSGPLEKSA